MRRILVRFSSPEQSTPDQCLADFIIITSEFEFSVHTALSRPFGRCRDAHQKQNAGFPTFNPLQTLQITKYLLSSRTNFIFNDLDLHRDPTLYELSRECLQLQREVAL